MAIIDFFDRGWIIDPGAVAYRTDDEEWTYDEAGHTSCRIAHLLLDSGAGRETKVAVLSPNAPLAWICVLGIWRAGGAWVPLNPASPVGDNAALLQRFDVEVVFFDASLREQAQQLRAANPRIRLIAIGAGTGEK